MKTVVHKRSKIGLVGDLHIGEVFYNNEMLTAYHNKKRDEFFDSMIADYKSQGIDTILFAGDIFHSRAMVGVIDVHYVLDLFSKRLKDFHIITIVGNHDMLYDNDDSVHMLEMLKFLSNVTVIEEPTKYEFFDGNSWYLFPWLGTEVNVEHAVNVMKNAGATREEAMKNVFFGHFDIMGIDMGCNNLSKNGFDQNEITQYCSYVISGHYHCKSFKKIGTSKILYLGSPYQLSFSHVGTIPGYYTCDSAMKVQFIENTINERFIDVHDYDDLENLPELDNSAVRYSTDNSRTYDDAFERRLKLEAKHPLYVKEAPYGQMITEDEDLVTLPVDTTEAERVTKMSQIEVAEHFMENSPQPLPSIRDGGDAKKVIMDMIQAYDAN